MKQYTKTIEHHMDLVQHNGVELLFVCPEENCGRQIILNTADRARFTVIEQGDSMVTHSSMVLGF